MSHIHVLLENLIDFSILMFQFKCRSLQFNTGVEIGEGWGRSLQLISMEFFWTFLDDYRHIFLRELMFVIERASSQQFNFQNYFD